MNITPLNSNITPNCRGRLIKKGIGWTPNLKYAFNNFDELKELTDGYDIVGRIASKKVKNKFDSNHYIGQKIYKLKLSFRKENSVKDKIKDFLGLLPRFSLTGAYHTEPGLITRFSKEYVDRLGKKIK